LAIGYQLSAISYQLSAKTVLAESAVVHQSKKTERQPGRRARLAAPLRFLKNRFLAPKNYLFADR
jgi:predicted acetyltransferase